MKKEEFIAKYGEEAYEEHKQKSKKYTRKISIWSKEDYIAKYGEERYLKRTQRIRENHKQDSLYRLYMINYGRKARLPVVSPDEAMSLLVKEAEECGVPELLNIDYMTECFHNNCKYGLVYGNLEILKYFYRLMQIKVAKNESFTESDKEMIRYFRNWEVGRIKAGILRPNNNWVIDAVNADMAYVEDMVRNVQGIDLLLTEEKYNELKGLTNDA